MSTVLRCSMTVAVLVFALYGVSACGSDPAAPGGGGGGGTGGTEDAGGTRDTDRAQDSGGAGGTRDTGGAQDTGGMSCEPACNAMDCLTCIDGACVLICGPVEPCDGAGSCTCTPVEPCGDPCDGACDAAACEVCDEGLDPPACVSTCGDCDDCEAGACESRCVGDEICAGGACVLPESCRDGEGACGAAVLSGLAIASGPNPAIAEEGCCCDFGGDLDFENGVGTLLAQVGEMLGLGLAQVNDSLAEALHEGGLLILFELVPLALADGGTSYYDVNAYLGRDADGDPTDDLRGGGEFYILPESLDEEGNALITFRGATVRDGVLAAGPTDFFLPLDLEDYHLNVSLDIEETSLTANMTQLDTGFELRDGTLCGYILKEELFTAVNAFAAGNCGCLDVTGDLIRDTGAGYACAPSGTPTCDAGDSIQSACLQLRSYCDTVVVALPMLLDIDVDDDGTGDAISIGARFDAAHARILGVATDE